jgi:glycosyltransferase involved in cell wall biosynthesis
MSEDALSVGVVIPVRNAARHLGRAIESVLAQQPTPADVVVVDGASSDGSVSVARNFPGVRILNQKGGGLAAARNQGLKAVSGELVAFCDADDRWSRDALAVRLTALQRRPEAMAVIGRVVLEEIEGAVPNAAQRQRIGRSMAGFTPGALLARRKTFHLVGLFDEELTIGSDSDWFVRLQQSAVPWMRIEATVLHKGARDDSLSTDIARYRRELLAVARRFVNRHRRKSSQ